MGTAMRVRDVMSAPVFTLRVDKQLIVAKSIMDWAKVRHVPVVDQDNYVVGMITQRDLLAHSISSLDLQVADIDRSQELWTIPIQRVMRRGVRTIGPNAPVQEAARLMREYKFGCLPVVEDEVLIGIVSEHDLLGVVAELPLAADSPAE